MVTYILHNIGSNNAKLIQGFHWIENNTSDSNCKFPLEKF